MHPYGFICVFCRFLVFSTSRLETYLSSTGHVYISYVNLVAIVKKKLIDKYTMMPVILEPSIADVVKLVRIIS